MNRLICLVPLLTCAAFAAEPAKNPDKQRAPRPSAFALVFSRGYAGDQLPKDDKTFEALLIKIKAAGFNVVHTTHTDKRLALCKKHGIKMMVDLLEADHHVYKNTDKAKALCQKLQKSPDVWGYNIWNDPVRKTGRGRKRDIANVRSWDPTHPAYCGTYRTEGLRYFTGGDVVGYYDFHWKRGQHQHFPHTLTFSNHAKANNSLFYTWLSASSGLAGKGNFNRNLWSANTGIACGLKGILWFLATDLMNAKSLEWTAAGKDIIKVHEQIAPLADELMKIGHPANIWTTPISKTANNTALPGGKETMMPPGLDKYAFPRAAWIAPTKGECLLGSFEVEKVRYVFIANHNAYAENKVTLKPAKQMAVEVFDRKTKKYKAVATNEGAFEVTLSPGGGELLKFSPTK